MASSNAKVMLYTRKEFLMIPAALFLSAGAPAQSRLKWTEKDPPAWNPDDLHFILNRSAWVREVQLESERSAAGMAKGASTNFKVVVRWESAAPIRWARDRSASPDKNTGRYDLSITGLPVELAAALAGDSSLAGADKNRIRSYIADQVAHSGTLVRPGHDPILATQAVWTDRDLASRLTVSFPIPPQPIAVEDRTVTLKAHVGVLMVTAEFALKAMVYRGRLEL
jgi:hypothetical protein